MMLVEQELLRAHNSAKDAPPKRVLLYEESLDELLGDGDELEAIIPGLAFRRLKTLLVGRSKAGKSFTMWMFLKGALENDHRVKYLTEESRDTVRDKLRTFGLMDDYGMGLHITRRTNPNVADLPWTEVVARMTEETKDKKFDLVIVDTMRPWLGLGPDESNKAEVMGSAIDALSPVCEAGAAVVVIHQAPWEALRARGSTEIHATVDIILGVEGEGYGPRKVRFLGGRVEGLDEERTVRWDGSNPQDLGRMRADKARRISEVLAVIECSEGSFTIEELEESTEIGVKALRRYLHELTERHLVVRVEGKPLDGRGGTPDKWKRPGAYTRLLRVPLEEVSLPGELSIPGETPGEMASPGVDTSSGGDGSSRNTR